ncbi:SHOCT domain-containing protein [Sporolituus thermophilus]|uniref:Putative membrane protein n=1 Tax=Sporolituus thermophilus DSM 23256 TaxID=1123285 RepID=A0A1G7KZB8_9FIRM|nr:SHOCT domain-containing protein [Sporolituus thermophilus]SDF42607.1 putative membrane protein [Sporolituus thermophilus DSM 23256]
MMMGYGFGGPLGWLGMGFGLIIHLAFAALIVMAAVWMFKAVFRDGQQANKSTRAVEILKERYARGEITNEEYQRMKKELE